VSLPLVSVITPTWGRHELLLHRCVPSVQAQTYPRVEHIIVSDGPDRALARAVASKITGSVLNCDRPVPVRFAQLAEHDPAPHHGHHGRLAGLGRAAGDLIAYLDDDDAYRPGHVAALAAALQARPDAAWAYSLMEWQVPQRHVIGEDPPRCGQIGTPMLMHRRALPAQWGPASPVEDWAVVERWLTADAPYVHVPEVTIDVWPSASRAGR
jgi:glycosyltransferase involved in cell wall biosynthesis